MPQIEEVEEVQAAAAELKLDDKASAEQEEAPKEAEKPATGEKGNGEEAKPKEGEGAVAASKGEEEKELTPEQLKEQEEKLEVARQLKALGNQLFAGHEYEGALEKYTEAIEASPDGHKEQAVFFNNRATCYFKLSQMDQVIKDCTSALRIDPDYAKCLLRRAQAYETEKKVCEAFDDFEKVLKLDSSNSIAKEGANRLRKPAEQERERLKEEMMGKLKDLGNTVLGKFGLSLDNFKATQDPSTGSYSISFQQ